MKNSKKLKLILNILICILIILIGIVGIYTKDGGMYQDLLPDYILGSDINGITVLEFEVDDSVETVYYDKEGNKVDSTNITEENKKEYEKKEIPLNSEEILNSENYDKTIEIMEKRLELLNVAQYQLNIDKETGKIILNVEDNYIEDIESILPMEAKLQLIDSNTKDVVLDYTDLKSAEAMYVSSISNEITTYIYLKLNDTGIEKINNIDKYKTVEVSDTSNEENKEEEQAEESKLIVQFDLDEIVQVDYDDIVLDGKTLKITTASKLTTESEINSELNMNAVVCKLSTIGKMPIVYNLVAEEFIKSDIGNSVNYITGLLIAICVVSSLVLIIKHKSKGTLAVLGFVCNIAVFLIIIRLTKIQISLNGFAGMIGLIMLNVILINNILNSIKEKDKIFSENVKTAYMRTLDILVIMLIIFIVFSFSGMTVINTMGLLLFWGWIVTVLGNLVFTVPMLSIVTKK